MTTASQPVESRPADAIGALRRVVASAPAIIAAIVLALAALFIRLDGGRLFWKRFLDGLSNGFVYAAVALALVLIYKATSIINFAQGSLAMFFTFVAWALTEKTSLPVAVAIIVAMILSAVSAAAFERVFIRPFDPANHLPITIVTIALLLLLDGFALLIWYSDPKSFPSPFPSGENDLITVYGARIYYSRIGIWLTVTVMALGLTLLLKKTKIGLAFRSVSSNLESSRLVGIDVGKTLQFGWALAAGIGTLAGCMVLADGRQLLEPSFMAKILVFSFAAATIGGLDSLIGALVGGLALGQLETMIGGYVHFLGSELVLATTLGLLIVMLLVRPNGLFGKRRVERV